MTDEAMFVKEGRGDDQELSGGGKDEEVGGWEESAV